MEKNTVKQDSTPSSILSSALHFASGTFLSRIGGLIRDISLAFCFGVTPAIAAFLVAFRFSNLLRRIFGEGALLNSFIPHFEGHRSTDPKQAARFFRDIFYSLFVTLTLIVIGVEIGLHSWLTYGDGSEGNRQIATLTMILFPGILFICLFSICAGLLQCEKKFFLVGVAPLLFNFFWIASIWMYKDVPSNEAVTSLSWAVTAGYVFQWLLTIPSVLFFLRKHLSWKECCSGSLFTQEIRTAISALSLGIIGVSASQINSGLDAIFARQASLEGPAYLNYAIHVEQLPLALFGIGLSMALLPSLSRVLHDSSAYKKILDSAVSYAIILLIPCFVGMIVLGNSGMNLIYGRGDFSQIAVEETTFCLWGYAFGLLPMGLIILLASGFYARKNYRIPTIGSFISLLVNVSLNYLFVNIWKYGPASLAVSTSIAAFCNLFFLSFYLSKILGSNPLGTALPLAFKTMFCSILGGIITVYIDLLLFGSSTWEWIWKGNIIFPRNLAEQSMQFSVLAWGFIVSFLLFAWLFQLKEIKVLKANST